MQQMIVNLGRLSEVDPMVAMVILGNECQVRSCGAEVGSCRNEAFRCVVHINGRASLLLSHNSDPMKHPKTRALQVDLPAGA